MKKMHLLILSLFMMLILSSCNFSRVTDEKLVSDGYSCIVTFDANGGKIGNYTQRLEYCKVDSYIIPPEEFNPKKEAVKDEFNFGGWYKGEKDSEGNVTLTEKFDFKTEKIKSNITLYAKWTHYYYYTIYYEYDEETKKYNNSYQLKAETSETIIQRPTTPKAWPKHTFLEYYEDEALTKVFDWTKLHEYDENNNVNIYSKYLNGSYVLVSKPSDLKKINLNTNLYLLNDVDMSGITTTVASGKYIGTIVGNGYKISNMTINYGNQSGNSDTDYGMFKGIDGANISNITFDNLTISASIGLSVPQYRVSIFSPTIKNATISNVKFTNSKFNLTVASGVNTNTIKQELAYVSSESSTISDLVVENDNTINIQ